jgi:hypothetical protein
MLLIDWQSFHKNISNYIVQASVPDGSDSWTEFPIGMGWAWYNYRFTRQIGLHSNTVLCAINPTTDKHRPRNGITRTSIIETLKSNNIQNTQILPETYFSTLSNYKFVISPEGNGIDCHRHYEALMYGCIPIVERNSLTEQKYSGLPVLWTIDYSEITEKYLTEMYAIFLQTDYDFSKLFLQYYPSNLQNQIKYNGDFWLKKIIGNTFYKNKLLPFLKV